MKITRYLSPEGDTGSGFMNGAFDNFGGTVPPKVEVTKVEPSNPAPINSDLVAQETTQLETLLAKDVTALTAEDKVKLDQLKTKYNITEVNEDGLELTPEQKQAKAATDKKISDISAKSEGQRTLEEIQFLKDNTQEVSDIYEEVDQLSGIPVAVDYGNIDPKSAEGILKREETIREQAANQYDAELKQEFPVAYQLMLHLKNGGKTEDFFKSDTDDYQSVVLAKLDTTLQETIYRKALTIRGNTPEQVDSLVQIAKDKGKLYDQSKFELENLQRKQLIEERGRAEGAKAAELKEAQLQSSFNQEFASLLEKGVKGVVIPKTERKQFEDFMKSSIYVQAGRLLYVKEINPKDLQDEVAANYFKFKKGDLSVIAARKASSMNADKVRASIKYKITPKSTADKPVAYTPLSQL